MSGSTTVAEATSAVAGASSASAGTVIAGRRRGDRLVGSSRAIQRALEQIAVAGRGRFPVFISGEDGVEKDLVARLIHESSDWISGGYFALDAALVPETLLAREIFGCERGALPALPAESVGALARTAGGTVVIDHVESLPKDLQQTLAAALAENRFTRVGGSATSPLDCRVIAAGTEPLDALVQSGRLTAELGERLSLLEIRLPALRERREDILPVASRALALAREELERELSRPPKARGFTREALERMREYAWPGNDHELREQVRAALRMARAEEIGADDLALGERSDGEIPSFRDAKRKFEREYVGLVLRRCKGNISRAARVAKKDRKDFYDVMRRNQIDPDEFR